MGTGGKRILNERNLFDIILYSYVGGWKPPKKGGKEWSLSGNNNFDFYLFFFFFYYHFFSTHSRFYIPRQSLPCCSVSWLTSGPPTHIHFLTLILFILQASMGIQWILIIIKGIIYGSKNSILNKFFENRKQVYCSYIVYLF
jgi:hypothetical protein